MLENKEIKRLASFLIKTNKFETKFQDIREFLSGIYERMTNRKLSLRLENRLIKKVISFVGGTKRLNGYSAFWNIKPKCELWPTVLLPSKAECVDMFWSRERKPEVEKQALNLYLSLIKGETNE